MSTSRTWTQMMSAMIAPHAASHTQHQLPLLRLRVDSVLHWDAFIESTQRYALHAQLTRGYRIIAPLTRRGSGDLRSMPTSSGGDSIQATLLHRASQVAHMGHANGPWVSSSMLPGSTPRGSLPDPHWPSAPRGSGDL